MLFHEPLPYEIPPKKSKLIKIAFYGDEALREVKVKEFNRLTGLTYCKHLVFSSRKEYEALKNEIHRSFKQGTLTKESEWFGFQYRTQVLEGKVSDVSIRWINNRIGFGLFAEEELLPGKLIGEYVGLIKKVSLFFSGFAG